MPRILHVLSQRPSLTGSGITLDALVRHAGEAGWQQRVVAGVPADDPNPVVGELDATSVLPLRFGTQELPFPVPGMSDVMPYPSTRFSTMDDRQITTYRSAWRRHLQAVISDFRPEIIHCHHIWILASMLKDIVPNVPVVNHCHATGLRQMALCPRLADGVRAGCSRNERFAVLHAGHAEQLCRELGVAPERVHIVGAGYREDLFHARGRRAAPPSRLLYIGKLSAAKGLPRLLDAFEEMAQRVPELELHVAGSGAGAEAEALAARLQAMAPAVVAHGHVDQQRLATLMRQCTVCVLPSFYEGLPLVLVEALAAGCRLVATALPGIQSELAPHLGDALHLVPMPRMLGIDRPDPEDLPSFVARLKEAISAALEQPTIGDPERQHPEALRHFRWSAVFRRVEEVWEELV